MKKIMLLLVFLTACTQSNQNKNDSFSPKDSDQTIDVSLLQSGNLSTVSDESIELTPHSDATIRSVSKVITLKNAGTTVITDLVVDPVRAQGYTISTNRCTASLAKGASCAITIQFSNRSLFTGTYYDTLIVSSAATNSSISINMTAYVDGLDDPSTLDPNLQITMNPSFSSGTGANRTMVIKNLGPGTATQITPTLAPGYVIVTNRCASTLKVGASCSIIIQNTAYRTNTVPPGAVSVSVHTSTGSVSKNLDVVSGVVSAGGARYSATFIYPALKPGDGIVSVDPQVSGCSDLLLNQTTDFSNCDSLPKPAAVLTPSPEGVAELSRQCMDGIYFSSQAEAVTYFHRSVQGFSQPGCYDSSNRPSGVRLFYNDEPIVQQAYCAQGQSVDFCTPESFAATFEDSSYVPELSVCDGTTSVESDVTSCHRFFGLTDAGNVNSYYCDSLEKPSKQYKSPSGTITEVADHKTSVYTCDEGQSRSDIVPVETCLKAFKHRWNGDTLCVPKSQAIAVGEGMALVGTLGNMIIFAANDPDATHQHLYMIDERGDNFVDLGPLYNSGEGYVGTQYSGKVVGGKLVFEATTSEHGDDLWVTDGTKNGTIPADLTPGSNSSPGSALMYSYMVSGRLVYMDGGSLFSFDGDHSWIQLADFGGQYGAKAAGLGIVNSRLIIGLVGLGDRTKSYVLSTDGTSSGTHVEVIPSNQQYVLRTVIPAKDKVILGYFTETDFSAYYVSSDGVGNATPLFSYNYLFFLGDTFPSLALDDGRVLQQWDGGHGDQELYILDFSNPTAPASLLKDLNPNGGNSWPANQQYSTDHDGISKLNNGLYIFKAETPNDVIVRSDLTSQGTQVVQSIEPNITMDKKMISLGNNVLFRCLEPSYRVIQICVSDGTDSGTYRITNFENKDLAGVMNFSQLTNGKVVVLTTNTSGTANNLYLINPADLN